jgi:hypothetical protein
MKNTLITLLFMIGCQLAVAQNKIIREVNQFDHVHVTEKIDVQLRESDTHKVTFTATGIDYDNIVTEVDGRELRVKLKPGIYKDYKIDFIIEYVKLRTIEAGNGAKITGLNTLAGDEMTIKASGNAVVNASVKVNALKAQLSTSGRIEIDGEAEFQEVEANTYGKYHGFELKADDGFVKANTGAEAVVYVVDQFEGSASSKGTIKYRGSPNNVKSTTSLGGEIIGNIEE